MLLRTDSQPSSPARLLSNPAPAAHHWLQEAGSQGLGEEVEASDVELSDQEEGALFQGEYAPAPYPGDMDAEE